MDRETFRFLLLSSTNMYHVQHIVASYNHIVRSLKKR